jgi:hypothetical protein
MEVLSSFADLPMYNFGVKVVTEMNETDEAYLEANIQASLAQKEIDLEDAIAIRRLKDVDQAEMLLIVRRKKRVRQNSELAAQNSQLQAQANQETTMVASQAKIQELQTQAQLEAQKIQLEMQAKAQLLQTEYALKMELARLEADMRNMITQGDKMFREQLEDKKEKAKDERVKAQAIEQSKLISQRKGERGELMSADEELMNSIFGGQQEMTQPS